LNDGKKVNHLRPTTFEIIIFGGYVIIGIFSKYMTLPLCQQLNEIPPKTTIQELIVPLLIIVIGLGIVSFFFPDIRSRLSRTGFAAISGFGVGIGILTVITLLTNFLCFHYFKIP
jgi:hypothetical protein